MIDNFDKITGLLTFDSEDDFYFLQILKRKKENRELGSNSLVVKTHYIKSVEHLIKLKDEIITMCTLTNSRAYINLNRRSFESIAFHTMRKVVDVIMNKDFKSVKNSYDSVCGSYSSEKEKKWIVDVDIKDDKILTIVANTIKNCDPNPRQDKVITIIDTKNGYHLITNPFNVEQFKLQYGGIDIDIHKDNPTILYSI